MAKIAFIGGTGLTSMANLEVIRRQSVETPYGMPSSELTFGHLAGNEVVFLSRHGDHHTIPPHRVNYRANLWALHSVGVEQIIAVAAVGGITAAMEPAQLAIPDQIIDYTHSREATFHDGGEQPVVHVDFSYPYSEPLRQKLLEAAQGLDFSVAANGTYGATQGPRLESAAEIIRMKQDGCDLVGMTGMPEAVLARELALDYACCAVVANWAAGCTEGVITMAEIEQTLELGMQRVRLLLERVVVQV